jgi:hypothetical protein
MDLSRRIVYWASISLVTFFTGSFIASTIGIYFSRRNLPDWLSWIIGGLASGLPVGTIAWFMNTLVFDIPIEKTFTFPVFIGYSTAIAIMVVVLNFLVSNKTTAHPHTNPATNTSTPSHFFARLQRHLGQNLISLEAQDPYINVKTTKGSEMILLRLGDAVKELENYPGLRTHRSWWVARDAISHIVRTNGKVELVLSDESVVPVSRANVKTVGKYSHQNTME